MFYEGRWVGLISALTERVLLDCLSPLGPKQRTPHQNLAP